VQDTLSALYPWVKAAHIAAVIAWMAGLFYLPRLFVYHAERGDAAPQAAAIFLVMERRLMNAIMRPAMIATWVLGVALVLTPGVVDWSAPWVWAKGLSVVAMTAFHEWLARRAGDFAQGRNRLTGRAYRIANEVPTILMLVIVFSVVLKY
jgi:protoporphyrinogen IX oxidase